MSTITKEKLKQSNRYKSSPLFSQRRLKFKDTPPAQRQQKCGSACVAAIQNMHPHKELSEFCPNREPRSQLASQAETPLLFSISKSASIAELNIACDGRCWFSPIRRHFLTVGDLRSFHSQGQTQVPSEDFEKSRSPL